MSRLSRPAQIVLGVGAIAVLGYLVVVPQFISASAAARTLTGVSPVWLGAAALAEAASLLAYARLSQHTLRPARIGFVPMLRIDLATLAVSHVTPAGFVVGAGLGFRMLTLCGVSPDRAVTGKTVQTVGSAIVLNVLLDVALVAAIVRHGTNTLYGTAAAVGVVLMAAVTTATVLLLRNPDRGAAVIGRIASVIPSVDADAGRRLAASLGDTLRLLLRDRGLSCHRVRLGGGQLDSRRGSALVCRARVRAQPGPSRALRCIRACQRLRGDTPDHGPTRDCRGCAATRTHHIRYPRVGGGARHHRLAAAELLGADPDRSRLPHRSQSPRSCSSRPYARSGEVATPAVDE